MGYSTNSRHEPGVWHRVRTRLHGLDAGRARLLGLLAVTCGLATGLLSLAEFVAAPAANLPGLLAITVSCGATLMAAALLLRLGRLSYALNIAGVALMMMGMAAGPLMPDGLAAAAILPLAGAVLTLPEQRGRPLAGMFILAFVAGIAGESAAYLYGGTAEVVGSAHWSLSLIQTGVMLAFVYGLVWWAGDRGWSATTRAQHAMESQRQLLQVNERLLSTLDPQGVLDLIADSLKPVLAYDNLAIYRVDRAAGVMRPMMVRDRFEQLIMGTTFPLDSGVTGWVIEHGEAQCVNDVQLDERAAMIPGTPDEPESLIVLPLWARGEVVGTLNLGRMGKAEAHFGAAEFELARLFAGQASIAIQNAETHRAVWNRAQTDSLTGLHNRGALDARLAALVETTPQSCALIMVDLDGFKSYNDRHGHPAGDKVLQAVGRAIDSSLRERDLSFRYGGDEFVILLPRTGVKQAAQIADRVRHAIKEHPIVAGTLTASAGVACHPVHAADASALISVADAALYRAKASGGDYTEVCGRRPTKPRRTRPALRTEADLEPQLTSGKDARLPATGRVNPARPHELRYVGNRPPVTS
ncbi:MAG TPA: sensor domain-containing diguanylate cyclase [Candidatus Limnocylindrales bacterium]|jgi:diguanylate cyclase (GGDEF) domain|nr:sensor domain-containing diguanylate cyclase [Candidatus Limnocylindrales bacterium]